MATINVVIADSSAESREQLNNLLSGDTDINVVADASDGREAAELVKSMRPDVLVCDVNIGGMDADKLTEQVVLSQEQCGVVIVSSVSDIPVVRTVMQAGAGDFLTRPLDRAELVDSLKRVYSTVQKRRALASGGGEVDTKGRIVTVYSPQGGSGKSILAGNLAVALAAHGSGQVVLVDLSLQFGNLDLMLNVSPENTLAGLAQKYNELDAQMMETYLTKHDSGLKLLSAPSTPQYAETITVYVVEQVLEVLRESCSYVVIDTPSGMQDTTLAALDGTDDILLLTTLDLLALHNTKTALDMLVQMYPPEKIRLVLNRANSDVGITPEDVESTLQFKIAAHIPSDGRVVVTSVNEGMPFVMSQPNAEISRRIVGLAYEIMGKEPPDEDMAQFVAASAKKKGMLSSLLGVGR
ncbi:MAG: histidine kinase [Armatimonadetes bacterium CG_4_10_14_3_um_filter_66_18]|nr:response regulator [Armatimonadota bacterium]OIP12692.1 MAG: hypothetical protein AUJ96_00115 [Armatimonadetes bacterium CG2_30_66_41]PIU88396.1 MAG: histidine kinase [Armatimonadetes bacterium CG06_land_8_20_14_3_00_66_21]PIX38974.1 MAG: histidine kinase [Armatimonadetes bacterium CG_4_8_14_3_um_filter_66_20]PIY51336.1 MAG: histidine kinase [Armatimonadetes bacterium CG_4_10_14_3_um_filter_66_18]PIZ30554.1 MAG: histidine kinase [Armatimonadetes bacterium CG_4_10_14_0_8_um_filter_66_14]